MADIKITWTDGSTTKTYVVKGGLRLRRRKTQLIPDFPLPGADDEGAVLSTLSGQSMNVSLSFIVVDRTDDYTGGTDVIGSGGGSADEQATYLHDEIFRPRGKHTLTDHNGNSYEGHLDLTDDDQQGSDPLAIGFQCNFKRGKTF